MHAYLFFGLPGSGKGTQRELIEKKLEKSGVSWVAIEMGALLRNLVKDATTPLKKQVFAVMQKGGIVPSAFPISQIVNALTHEEKAYEYIIFDGVARKKIEGEVVVELLNFFPDMHIHVILLQVPADEVKERLLKRNRHDDVEESIQLRIEKFEDSVNGTTAAINFFKNVPGVHFHTIDGTGTVEEVHERMIKYFEI